MEYIVQATPSERYGGKIALNSLIKKTYESPSSAFLEQIWPAVTQDEDTLNSESPSSPFHAHQYKCMYTFPPKCPSFGHGKQQIVVTVVSFHKALFLMYFPNW